MTWSPQHHPTGSSTSSAIGVYAAEGWTANRATVLKALGKQVDERWMKAAQIAEEMSAPGYPLIRLNAEDGSAALRRMPAHSRRG